MATSGYARRAIPIALLSLAVIGWMLALYFMAARSRLQSQFEDQVQAVGSLRDLQQEIGGHEVEADRLRQSNRIAEEELTAREVELAALQAQVEAAASNLSSRQSDLQSVEARLAPLREELQTFDARLAETQQRLAARSEELAEVGGRLTDVRAREAEVQGRVATLSEAAARLTAQAAEAEERVQVAREAEASQQAQLVSTTTQLEELRGEHERLSQELLVLRPRRERLLEDTEEAAVQRDALQGMVAEISEVLATRSSELAELERRVEEMQARANQAAAVALAETEQRLGGQTAAETSEPGSGGLMLTPGEYRSDDLIIVLAEDGTFLLEEEDSTNGTALRQIRGRYGVDGEMLTLLEAQGEIGEASFPMSCLLAPSAVSAGLAVLDANGSCVLLAGRTLGRQDGGAEQGEAPRP